MQLLAGFIVGCLLGWVVTWMLQRRMDDSLTDEVARLQRELTDCQRELDKTKAASGTPQIEASEIEAEGDADEAATRATGIAALAVEETAQEPEATAGETVVAAVAVEAVEDEAAEDGAVAAEAVEEVAVEEVADEEVVETRADDSVAAAVAAAAVAETSTVTYRAEGVADLTVIKGIGPKFAETLNAAGITSYAALADTTPEQLQEIVQPAAWQKVDFEDWIAQASALSRQGRRLQIGDDLTRLEGIGPEAETY